MIDRLPKRVEWPTLMVVALFALGLTSVVRFHDRMPVVSTLALLAVLGAWYGSLQHEVVHGHPTPWARLNVALVGTPLGLIFPFWLYRSDHLEHHATRELTDPISDPESAYLLEARWDATSSPIRALRRCNTTLIGRMAIGPAFVMADRTANSLGGSSTTIGVGPRFGS